MSIQRNLHTETVDQCHLEEPLCLPPETRVDDAMRRMSGEKRGATLICRENRVEGIFTERDALRLMAGGADLGQPLEKVMTPRPFVLHHGDTVGKAIGMMSAGGYRRLPIVDETGQPTGLLKVEAILHYLAEHFPEVIYNLPPTPHHTTQQREGA